MDSDSNIQIAGYAVSSNWKLLGLAADLYCIPHFAKPERMRKGGMHGQHKTKRE